MSSDKKTPQEQRGEGTGADVVLPADNLHFRQIFVHVAAGAAGFIIATGVALLTGIPVAWATLQYFIFGWPLMCLVIYLLARAYPVRAWRWTLSMMLGQVFSTIFFGGGPFMPVAMAFVTLLSIPQFYVGSLGSKAGMRRLAASQPQEFQVQEDKT